MDKCKEKGRSENVNPPPSKEALDLDGKQFEIVRIFVEHNSTLHRHKMINIIYFKRKQ